MFKKLQMPKRKSLLMILLTTFFLCGTLAVTTVYADDDDACLDSDGDLKCDDNDPCPLDSPDDTDDDGVCDVDDACHGCDDNIDINGDGTPDGCDTCEEFDMAMFGTGAHGVEDEFPITEEAAPLTFADYPDNLYGCPIWYYRPTNLSMALKTCKHREGCCKARVLTLCSVLPIPPLGKWWCNLLGWSASSLSCTTLGNEGCEGERADCIKKWSEEFDRDRDGVENKDDNCPDDYNPNTQSWADDNNNGIFDACEDPPPPDTDGDGVPDGEDNCPTINNDDQEDVDADLVGDVCDNCPDDSNDAQHDSDGDGLGNVCDPTPYGQVIIF